MKKIIILSATLLLVFLVAHSWAVPIGYLKLTSGSAEVIVDDNDSDGLISYIGDFGNFDVNLSFGTYEPKLKPSVMDLLSGNISSTSGESNLTIEFTVKDYTYTDIPGYLFAVGGTGAGMGKVSFEAWWNYGKNNETQLAYTDFINNTNNSSPFSDMISYATTSLDLESDPYSLTIIANITHTVGQTITSFDAILEPVPEPSTILLFGIGLIGLAAYGRSRKLRS